MLVIISVLESRVISVLEDPWIYIFMKRNMFHTEYPINNQVFSSINYSICWGEQNWRVYKNYLKKKNLKKKKFVEKGIP